jgi:hypothetical protein
VTTTRCRRRSRRGLVLGAAVVDERQADASWARPGLLTSRGRLARAAASVGWVSGDLWEASRSGSHAGRGFRYQDGVATELAVRSWRGDLDARRIVPEGLEDISVELGTGWVHLQAKSRREHRGQFTLPELTSAWRHLAERLAADPSARAVLVLERPLPGAESGLDRRLADTASVELRIAVAGAVGETIEFEDFLARTHVVVMPSPVETAVALLAEALDRSPAACVAHEAILRTALGRLADDNGLRGAADPAAMSAADIARLLDDVTESSDPSLLDEAVRTGIAELVDFMTPVTDPGFFRGVDVLAGHVVAGLPLPRPEVDQLVDGLAARRLAIAVGPSGAGKSALIWLTAFATRHAVRWYRVHRLNDADVPALVRLVKGQAGAAVGFVVDDLGRDDRAGFDRLVDQLRDYPDSQIVAACREEDRFLLRTAGTGVQVRPVLGPQLAERIWQELHDAGGATWPAWREPYESSNGLLLEYGHLLTQGNRLAETVTAQVDQRVKERRDVELDVLTLVSTSHAFGAEIEVRQLGTALSTDSAALKAALVRLIDEHLVHEHGGFLGGLHEVRSRHLMLAAHRVPPPTFTETIQQVIHLLTGAALQPFLTRLLLEEAVPDDVVVHAVAARLDHNPDLAALAAALHALRVVGFRRTAEQWRAIADAEGVAPTDIALIGLALPGGDDSFFPEDVRRTIARIRQLDNVDLRASLLPKVRKAVSQALTTASDLPSAITVLAALGEMGQAVEVDATALARLAAAASFGEVRTLLEAASAAAPELAITIVDGLGGPTALLERLQREQPWVRNTRLGVTDDGRSTAEAEYAYVAESAQPDGHGAVVDLARWLAALVPTADVAVCRAIDATGGTAGFKDVPIADKAIDRRNLPNRAIVAWNRARVRAAIAVVAAPTATDYAVAARDVVLLSKQVVQEMAEAFARSRRPTPRLVKSAMTLADTANRLRPAPIGVEAAGPLDEGELPMNDPVTFIARLIANNLFPRLFRGERVAPMIQQLIEQVDEVSELDVWRFLEKAPTVEVTILRRLLVDLHDVVSECATGRGARAAVAAAGRKGLSNGATAARRHAEARARAAMHRVERALAAAGFNARVLRRIQEPNAYSWPTDELLVLIDVTSVPYWVRHTQQIADLCRQQLPERISFLMAPVRNRHVVASYGVKVVSNFFPDDTVRTWPNLKLLDEVLGGIVRQGVSGLLEASGVIASIRGEQIHDIEMTALDAAALRARKTSEQLARLASQHPNDRLLAEVFDAFADLAQAVEDEAAALREGKPVQRGVAATFINGMRGEPNEVFTTIIGMFAACAEWDIDPIGAWGRFEHQTDANTP